MRNRLIAPLILFALPLLLWVCGQPCEGAAARRQTYEFVNGRWFDGQKFVARKFYAVGVRLTSRKPARVDSVIDLAGKYVVPPFGEAHNHNVEWRGEEAFTRTRRMYLEAGVFYVKNPNNLPRARAPLLGRINIPTSIDVVFANGGLTATGGHPLGVVRRNLERGGMTKEDAEGAFYFAIDNLADLERKWETITAGRPDFIKTYLQYSEEYAKRRDDESYIDWRGLDPSLLPAIVRRAHRAGLRVSTHVETATDFHHAVVAGVDEINHMPGFRPEKDDWAKFQDSARYKISETDARLAARKRVVVVTTLVSAIDRALEKREGEAAVSDALRSLLVHNLQTLNRHGVRIAIGSDSYRQTSQVEALNLHRLKVFDNLTLLKMWCETTARAIFPNRRIGHLKEGYEASFLVLNADPLEDFNNVRKIDMRVKQGEILSLQP
ncbi:MAG TPA: amidohydrolase family protein [Pyrinomonadaceae bacterium]|nr:amidohydrolase family protein [Pyrinomonadaceae bacterium]